MKAPWGDDLERISEWSFGPVGQPEFDRVNSEPPVAGLFSNVAEWTSSWAAFYPSRRLPGEDAPKWVVDERIVRGGPPSVVERGFDPREEVIGPQRRFPMLRRSSKPGVGFRCARSAKPRRRPEDFGKSAD